MSTLVKQNIWDCLNLKEKTASLMLDIPVEVNSYIQRDWYDTTICYYGGTTGNFGGKFNRP